MLYSAMGSTTKYWYRAERSAGQYWWHFSCQGDRKVSVSPCTVAFPPGLSLAHTYPTHLAKLGQHHDDGGVVLPQHPPEILGGLCQRPLGSDVRLLLSGIEPNTTGESKGCVWRTASGNTPKNQRVGKQMETLGKNQNSARCEGAGGVFGVNGPKKKAKVKLSLITISKGKSRLI